MTTGSTTMVVGVGSHHGDDQAGWLVIDRLQDSLQERLHDRHCLLPHVKLRKALIPLDLLDWMDGVQTLHIVDACHTDQQNTPLVRRFAWRSGQLVPAALQERDHVKDDAGFLPASHSGSHDFGVLQVLQLAEFTAHCPAQIFVWAVANQQAGTIETAASWLSECLRARG